MQIKNNAFKFSYAKARVKIHEYIDGSIAIFHGPRKIAHFPYEQKSNDNKACGLYELVDKCFAFTHTIHKGPQAQQQIF